MSGGDSTQIIAQLATAFGPTGVVVGYLVWREARLTDKYVEALTELSAALASLREVIINRRGPDV